MITTKSEKSTRLRCFFCKKKTLFVHKCMCNEVFCLAHKYTDTHNCPFEKTLDTFKTVHTPCVPKKVEKI